MLSELSLPASCLTETWLVPATGTGKVRGVLGNTADPKCWPGGLGTTISPAICPSGYTRACDIASTSRADASETLWACCPSGFTCDGGDFSCYRPYNREPAQTYPVTYSNNLGQVTTTSLEMGGLNAHSVRVAFHSSDIRNQFPPGASLPPPTATSSIATSVSSATPQVTSATPQVTSSQSLSAGGFVGIGVGSALGAVLLISGVAWLVRRRHYRNRQQEQEQQQQQPGTSEYPSNPEKTHAELLSISQPSELTAAQRVYELDSRVHSNNDNISSYTHG
ncbi:hypothetical protein NUW58_g1144 [Xylaria curta]|uniref:Uncharacterized protein n=1 Tax=Xylaria curta TaxID=42375 RepID=A0ACC1PN51_9PEZI|nr:hypothetical protein NUW58_g1144 [Xylaria curta]